MIEVSKRLQKLRQIMTEKDIESVLITQPFNRYYLSGFDGSSGFLLITSEMSMLATDFRYIEQAKKQAPMFKIIRTHNDFRNCLFQLVNELSLERLGFETEDITFAIHHQLIDKLGELELQLELIPLDGLVETLRLIKEPEEIELIARAAALSDRALEYITEIIHDGMSEKEVAWEIEKHMREQGSEPIPFNAIVASGPNAALPHAKPSTRTINSKEPVLIDIGANVDCYSSDLSRTICLDSSDSTFNRIYQIILEAQSVAINHIKEGMTGKQADDLARNVISRAGYGEAFGHSLGHGIGLAPHERPRLGPNSTDVLDSGMVFTIEPGIYLPGWGGIRIEDTVVIENGQVRTLSKARKTGVLI